MKFSYVLVILFVLIGQNASAQAPADTTPVSLANFHITPSDAGFHFTPDLPPLIGKAGGRAPFYTYLWDFGDGHFSFRKNPEHRYADSGLYKATLYVVNNYDDGPRPKRRIKTVSVNNPNLAAASISPAENNFFSSNGIFQIAKNTNALPGENMTLIIGVKHPGKGRVFLLTNEKIYGTEGLALLNQTTYNKENLLPAPTVGNLQGLWASVRHATLTFSGSPDYGIKKEFTFKPDEAIDYFSELYDSYKTISDYQVNSTNGKPQFSFINLKATPEMLADTNAIITITGVYLPEDGGQAVIHKVEVPVVTSHDPNNMSMKNARMSYRTLSKSEKLIYKIKFQNDGKGDAKNIWLKMQLPKQVDPTTFKLLSLYPHCDSCQTKADKGCWERYAEGTDTLVFHFKGISLPGRQAEVQTTPDSTKGFIRFSIKTDKKLKNKPFHSSTLIFFDKNEPIETNSVTGRFKKGFSPIIFAGYSGFMPQFNTGKYKEQGMAGIGLAPIAPYKKLYFQFEAYASLSQYSKYLNKVGKKGVLVIDPSGTGQPRDIAYKYYDKALQTRNLKIRLVPLHLRYNFTNFISAGIGVLAQFKMNLDSKEDRIYAPVNIDLDPIHKRIGSWEDASGKKFKVIPFLDLNIGRVYLGPSLGLRYYYSANDRQHLNLYIAWRL